MTSVFTTKTFQIYKLSLMYYVKLHVADTLSTAIFLQVSLE